MRLTILGSSASYAHAGQACAGYLVETDTTRILLDCGHGALANLTQVVDPLALDAVFVSHAHIDHFADVYALQALLRYAPEGPAPALALYAPAGLFERMKCLLSEKAADELDAAFDSFELAEDTPVTMGDVAVTPIPVEHAVLTYALRVEAGSRVLCYTADAELGDGVRRAAAGCDLLLAEATLPEKYASRAAHMTAAQAGALARDCGTERLVLTHIWPTNDRKTAEREAWAVFGQPVYVAREFDVFVLE